MKKIIFVLIIGALVALFFLTDSFTFGGKVTTNFTAILFFTAVSISVISILNIFSASIKKRTEKKEVTPFRE